MLTRAGKMRWPLLAATVAALAVASIAGAGHGPADAVTALHLGQTNTTAASTDVNTSGAYGIRVTTSAVNANALEAFADATTGAGAGLYAETRATSNTAAVDARLGSATPGTFTAAVRGIADSTNANGPGVHGWHLSELGTSPGVLGQTDSSANASAGVFGTATASSGALIGTVGTATASPNGIGLFGAGGSVGVFGVGPLAGLFVGNVHVQGTLSKSAGGFKIDHPLAPASKYLQHSFVESPEMKNVYDGVVRTNAKGFASVRLPSYFQALNRDFRYQLTLLGRSGWGAQAVVWREIKDNRFLIRSKPRVKVSWQVTGIRKDHYARANPIRVELTKPAGEQGRYLAPELYGRPTARAVHEQLELPER